MADENALRRAEERKRRLDRNREAVGRFAKFDSRLKRLEAAVREMDYRLSQVEEMTVGMARIVGRRAPTKPRPKLSRRKWQVIEAYARGLGRSEVARELGIAPHTVSSHMHEIYGMLPNVSRCVTSVLVECYRNGWLPDE